MKFLGVKGKYMKRLVSLRTEGEENSSLSFMYILLYMCFFREGEI